MAKLGRGVLLCVVRLRMAEEDPAAFLHTIQLTLTLVCGGEKRHESVSTATTFRHGCAECRIALSSHEVISPS
jgi:hypothetical protein